MRTPRHLYMLQSRLKGNRKWDWIAITPFKETAEHRAKLLTGSGSGHWRYRVVRYTKEEK